MSMRVLRFLLISALAVQLTAAPGMRAVEAAQYSGECFVRLSSAVVSRVLSLCAVSSNVPTLLQLQRCTATWILVLTARLHQVGPHLSRPILRHGFSKHSPVFSSQLFRPSQLFGVELQRVRCEWYAKSLYEPSL